MAIFLTSGFQAIKPRATSTVPPTPENARLTQGAQSGTLVFQFKKSRNTQSCSIQTASSPSGPWVDYGVTSRSKTILSNLPTMAVTWARAKANGAAGASGWTEPTCKAVI